MTIAIVSIPVIDRDRQQKWIDFGEVVNGEQLRLDVASIQSGTMPVKVKRC